MFWNGSTAIEGLSGSASNAGQGPQRRACARRASDAIDTHRPGDVLQLLLAEVVRSRSASLPRDLLGTRRGDADPAGLGECLRAARRC